MADYYDLVLALIPLSIVGIVGPMLVLGISATEATVAGFAVAVVLVGHALFVRSPTVRHATALETTGDDAHGTTNGSTDRSSGEYGSLAD